jgi:integrase
VIRVERAYDPKACEYVTPKSRAGVRRVPIPTVLKGYLMAIRKASGLVFGDDEPFDRRPAVSRAVDAWTAAGLDVIGLHEARHTYASMMIAAGVNAKALSEFLGHASVAITLDRYGHLMPGAHGEAASLLDAFLGVATGSR